MNRLILLGITFSLPVAALLILIFVFLPGGTQRPDSPGPAAGAPPPVAETRSAPRPAQDPLADLGFRLEIPAGLTFNQRDGNVLTYTRDGGPAGSLEEPLCLVGSIQTQVPAAERRQFADRLLEQTGLLSQISIREARSVTIAGLEGYELEGTAHDSAGQVALSFYQLTLFNSDHCLFVQGLVGTGHRDEYLAKYRQIGQSFQLR